jgi:hypothetical protein
MALRDGWKAAMSSIEDVIANLTQVLDKADAIHECLNEVEAAWSEASISLEASLTGSGQSELEELRALGAMVDDRLGQVRAALAAGVDGVRTHRERLRGLSPTGSAVVIKPTKHDEPRSSATHAVRAKDGSLYPAPAAWCVDVLPRRVLEGQPGEKTVGYVDGSFTPFTSGRDGTWTPLIERRLAQLKIVSRRTANFVSSHVEMKVATMMITEGRRTCHVVINHSACGSQPSQLPGCHQVLGPYLPKGYTLVVCGTTQQGEPFSRTYEGQA